LNIKAPQQHDSLFTVDTAESRIWWINAGTEEVSAEFGGTGCVRCFILVVYRQDAIGASEAVIVTAVIDCSDAVLTQCCGTHDARLNRDIEVGLV
jgi:hypothetical protein